VIAVAATVKYNLLHTTLLGPPPQKFPNQASFLYRGAFRLQFGIERRGGSNRMPLIVVNQLGIDLVDASKDVESWAIRGSADL
jgi:hypothetical protein